VNVLLVLASSLLGLVAGPTLYAAALRAGSRRPRALGWECEWCSTPRRGTPWLRCQSCDRPLRRREPVWWLVSAAAFGAASSITGFSWTLPAYLVFAAVTVVLTVTDLDHKLIPNSVLYPGGIIAGVLLVFGSLLDGEPGRLPRSLAAGGLYFGVLFLVALVARGGFGFGDVKLAALLGPFVAYQDWEHFVVSIFFTGVYGGLPAIILLVFRRARLGDELPYGPAMVLGAWTALLAGAPFIGWIR
jgi:leader peptidase (prepilin peptidase)/N-methyltransferase